MSTETDRAAKLADFHAQLLMMSEMLICWLDSSHSYSSFSIFFLAGVLMELIGEGWPDAATRPPIYTDLMTVLDRLGAELGPMIVAVQLDDIPAPKKTTAKYSSRNPKSIN